MIGLIAPGDLIVGLDDEDTRGMTAATLTRLMAQKANQKERKITMSSSDNTTPIKGPALIFGASGETVRSVLEGLVDSCCYSPVYAFGRHLADASSTSHYLQDALGAKIWLGDVQNPERAPKTVSIMAWNAS